MIDDNKVDDALNYLRTNAPIAAQARSHKVYVEEFRKTVKAQQMALRLNLPVNAQEREAYASEEYQKHLLAIKDAVYQDELHRWGMVAATSLIEAWRTQNANSRSQGKMQ